MTKAKTLCVDCLRGAKLGKAALKKKNYRLNFKRTVVLRRWGVKHKHEHEQGINVLTARGILFSRSERTISDSKSTLIWNRCAFSSTLKKNSPGIQGKESILEKLWTVNRACSRWKKYAITIGGTMVT